MRKAGCSCWRVKTCPARTELESVFIVIAIISVHIAPGGGKDRAQDASDYGRDRARAAQDRFNRGYENTPTGGDIRREGKPLILYQKEFSAYCQSNACGLCCCLSSSLHI